MEFSSIAFLEGVRMDNQQRHEMILEQDHSSGVQQWDCPTCGQSLLVTWAPRFMTIIRKAGNKSALHKLGDYQQGGSGERVSLADNAWEEEPELLVDEARLAPWIAWMEAVGFENLWNNKVE
jgi:hypothetical protein